MARKISSALLVDDDTAFRCALQSSLRRRGVRALTAASVDEGYHVLEDRMDEDDPVDLVAIDYRMPGTDGLVAITRYRKLCPDAVIVMLTGFGDIPLTVAAMREGADTLLTKPVDVDRLLREAAAVPAPDREGPRPPPSTRTYKLEEVERETIEAALNDAGGVVATAAKMLGIDRRTLQRKLKRLS